MYQSYYNSIYGKYSEKNRLIIEMSRLIIECLHRCCNHVKSITILIRFSTIFFYSPEVLERGRSRIRTKDPD